MKNVFGVIDTACTKISDKKVKFLSETEFKKALAHESGAQKKLQWAPKVYPVFFFFFKKYVLSWQDISGPGHAREL
jgi:hypothetical protein